MVYSVQHVTRFRYSDPIVENVMEVRLQPLSDARQQCLSFDIMLSPAARTFSFRDHLDNIVHFFDVAGAHRELAITANSVVTVQMPPVLPDSVPLDVWAQADAVAAKSANWQWLQPSPRTPLTPLLQSLATEFGVDRRTDPLTALHRVNTQLHDAFAYEAGSTDVDSPIDEALLQRSGVCQDFSHIMLALVRHFLHLPCRYVSGYLFHGDDDRSDDDATHAWIEVLFPDLGWVGFDPTNNLVAGERHIRVASGRDYSDVPPTHGIFRGSAESELSVSVKVGRTSSPLPVQASDDAPQWQPDHHQHAVVPWIQQQQQQQQ